MKLLGNPGEPIRVSVLLLIALIIFASIPGAVGGSTPLQLPQLHISVPNGTVTPDRDLVVTVDWYHGASTLDPPAELLLSLYRISDQSLITTHAIPGEDRENLPPDMAYFSGSIQSSELPAGEVMLIATDPVSGAIARQPLTVTEAGKDYPYVHQQRARETAFWSASVLLLVLLGGILVVLIRRGSSMLNEPETVYAASRDLAPIFPCDSGAIITPGRIAGL